MVNTSSGSRDQYRRKVGESFPDVLNLPEFGKAGSLRYGQNPGGPAAFYAEKGASGNIASMEVIQDGKGLGYINIGDMDLGQRLLRDLHTLDRRSVFYVIIKHEIPSAVGRSFDKSAGDAFDRAWRSDPLSSFGGVHVTSGTVESDVARELVDPKKNVEVIYAPDFSPAALEVLRGRENLRIVRMASLDEPSIDGGTDYKGLEGGMLAEARVKSRIWSSSDVECLSQWYPNADQYAAALLTWHVARWTRSNAIVVGDKNKTHGVGSGQQSRIDATHMATYKANGRDGMNEFLGHTFYGSRGTVLASDGFLPFPDVVELAAENGIEGIIAPVGSVSDARVIEAVDRHKMFFLATRKKGEQDSERGFLHR